MEQIINGSDLMLFVNGKAIANATSHTLSITYDTIESSTKSKDHKGGAWKIYKISDKSWTASSENLYSRGGNGKSIEDILALEGQEVTLVFADVTEADLEVPEEGWTPKTGMGLTGKAVITSIEYQASDGENSTFSVSFQGTGELKRVQTEE